VQSEKVAVFLPMNVQPPKKKSISFIGKIYKKNMDIKE